jgi:hypothetical protein
MQRSAVPSSVMEMSSQQTKPLRKDTDVTLVSLSGVAME